MKKIRFILFFTLLTSILSAQEEEFRTSYKIFGEGLPLLLINGGPGFSSEGFTEFAKELSRNNQVIIYDQRGTGNSKLEAINSSTITLELMVEDIEHLREDLKIDEWIVMGHSFGGMLAAAYAAAYPDKIKGIIFSHSGGLDLGILGATRVNSRLSKSQQDSLRYWNHRLQNGDRSYKTKLKRGMFLAPAYLEKKEYVPQIAERLTQGNMRLNTLVWRNMRSIEFDTKSELRKFEKSVLIIHGLHDVVPLESAFTCHEVFPNSTLVVLEKSSHYGWLDQASVYYKAIFDFLEIFNA